MKLIPLAVLAILSGSPALAVPVASLTLPEMAASADSIVVGTVGDTRSEGRAAFDTGLKDPQTATPISFTAIRGVGSVRIESVLKGAALAESVEIAYPARDDPAPAGIDRLTRLKSGERVLLFLSETPQGFSLLAPSSFPGPKVVLGGTPGAARGSELPPLRRTLLYLTAALSGADAEARRAGLEGIRSTASLLEPETTTTAGRIAARLRASLAEPSALDLQQFVRDAVLPEVLRLARGNENALKADAVMTAAALRSADVLPELIALAREREGAHRSAALDTLGRLRDRAAVEKLTPLLADPDPALRQQAARALRAAGSPSAVPPLLARLDDPDLDVRYYVVTALSTITGEAETPSISAFRARQGEIIDFWRRWAATRKDAAPTAQ